MNERIKNYVAQAPFSPVDFTWIDFIDIEHETTQEEYDAYVAKHGIEHFLKQNIKDVPLPLEKVAAVVVVPHPSIPNMEKGVIFTLERVNSNMLGFALYNEPSEKQSSAHLAIENNFQQPAVLVFSDSYLKFLRQNDMDTGEISESIGAAFERIMASVLMLGCKGTPYEYAAVYRCEGDEVKNAKRIRKGKRAFWEWKTIVIEPREVVYISESKGGTHASPKPHERMGHWRTYSSGKRVFVRASIVNKHKMPEEGYIFHDYIKGEVNESISNT